MMRGEKGVAAIIVGAIIAALYLLLGVARARARGKNVPAMGWKESGKAAREKVLAADPRDILAGLDADTRRSIEGAEKSGVDAGTAAGREALHRR
jgi:hypothetical protein